MDKRVFDYIKEHPQSSHHQIAKVLGIPETKTLLIIEKLVSQGLVQCEVLPLGNQKEADCSNFYFTVANTISPECTDANETANAAIYDMDREGTR